MRVRRRVFVGCEGHSERSYARWLQFLVDETSRAFHLETFIAGGGDPLGVVQQSVKRCKKREREVGKFHARFVLLDIDKIGLCPERDQLIERSAAEVGLVLIYQSFEHEAVLLRHFSRCQNKRPPAGAALAALRKVWADYKKPADAKMLATVLDLQSLKRARQVEARLDELAVSIRL